MWSPKCIRLGYFWAQIHCQQRDMPLCICSKDCAAGTEDSSQEVFLKDFEPVSTTALSKLPPKDSPLRGTVHTCCVCFFFFFFFLRFYLFYFYRGERKEKEKKRNINVWLPLTCPLLGTWPATQACALDWELNWWPFGPQASAQSTEPHQPGMCLLLNQSSSSTKHPADQLWREVVMHGKPWGWGRTWVRYEFIANLDKPHAGNSTWTEPHLFIYMVDAYWLFGLGPPLLRIPHSHSCQPLRIMTPSHNQSNFKILECQTYKDLGGY